ncbi:MAG: Uma2 family endonuclease [Syntrophobacteraceae bacterium]|nr:Uma2 family endonuclease [Syntrophobacteraceae bacterium]
MSEPAKKKATYEDLFSVPENMIGEIIDGELVLQPRPSPKHMNAIKALSLEIVPPYERGQGGGPGGWVFLFETEVRLGESIFVPDLAGWKKERFPARIETNWIPVAPDWVCEVLSPSTALRDRTMKKEIYAQAQVGHLWLVDPHNMTVEVYRLVHGAFDPVGVCGGKDKARLAPFTDIEIDLGSFWLDG